MSKPGEMVQLLREDYEATLEAYRLLRNKFLKAVPGMNLDKEKLLYEHWITDLHINSIIDFDRIALLEAQLAAERLAREPAAQDARECGIDMEVKQIIGSIPSSVFSSVAKPVSDGYEKAFNE